MSRSYRADQVGSLLRPAAVIEAHLAREQGDIEPDDLAAIEDREIRAVVELQKAAGIDVITDGEFRRDSWTGDLRSAIEGYVLGEAPVNLNWRATQDAVRPPAYVIGGKLESRGHYVMDEARFLKQVANGTPFKVTLAAPSYIVARAYNPAVSAEFYPRRADALADVAAIIRKEVKALLALGVSYIQLDNPHYTDYFMPRVQDQWRALGVDPDQALVEDVAADNAAFEDLDLGDSVIGMHFCRGNGGATGWHSEGGYDPVADVAFGGLKVNRLLLEYDSDRAGGFAPLRMVAKDTTVVLGLVTTKASSLEDADTLCRRIDEAAKIMPIERLALSPQCGFASVLKGNPLTVDDQKRKLELVSTVARKMWGD